MTLRDAIEGTEYIIKVNGDSMWNKFNQKDPKQQKWYYSSIAKYTEALKEYRAWQEYNELVKIIFGKGE